MKFRENVVRFMGGRYGSDQLNITALGVCMALLLVNTFVRSAVLYLLVLAVMIWSVYRTMSRNIGKRRSENEKFLGMVNKCRSTLHLWKRRFADRRTHVYRTCPSCGRTLRLPRQKGEHTVCCPCCHSDFTCNVR